MTHKDKHPHSGTGSGGQLHGQNLRSVHLLVQTQHSKYPDAFELNYVEFLFQ